MTLRKWLKKNNMKQVDLARLLGVSKATVCYIVARETCSKRLYAMVTKITNGELTYLEATHGHKYRTDRAKMDKLVKLKQAGVDYDDIAERFGYGSRKQAYQAVYYAEKKAPWNNGKSTGTRNCPHAIAKGKSYRMTTSTA